MKNSEKYIHLEFGPVCFLKIYVKIEIIYRGEHLPWDCWKDLFIF